MLTAIADARPGGVLFHCMGGRDRTGMITMLVLALVGVAPEDIAADYELSAGHVRRRRRGHRRAHARAGTTARAELLRTLERCSTCERRLVAADAARRRYGDAAAVSAITRESWPPCHASGDLPGSSDSSRAPGIASA